MYSFEAVCKREKNSSLTHTIFLVAGGFLVDKNFRNAYLALVLLAQRKGPGLLNRALAWAIV
jgi:hypothetical protein